MIVVDTNVLVQFLLPNHLTAFAKDAARKDQWCAPLLWRSEFRNVLTTYVRQAGLPMDDARELMALAERLFWSREFPVRSSTVLDCVAQSKRSAYDCEFVALAMDFGIKLVTTDEPIVVEFPKVAVRLQDYVSM